MKDFTRVNIVAQGKGGKKKKSSEGHFTIRELTVKEKNEPWIKSGLLKRKTAASVQRCLYNKEVSKKEQM